MKTIAISPVTSVESHCHADYVTGNHNWIWHCMIDPGGNINCDGYKKIKPALTPLNGAIILSVALLKLLKPTCV